MTELTDSIARDYGLPVVNQFGQFQVGGPLTGHAGTLDRLYDIAPGVGDIRALARGARAGAATRLEPDLLGGARAVPTRTGEAAFEIGTALPVVGDIGTGAKLGAQLFADYGLLGGLGRIVFHGSPHRFAPEPDFPLGRFKHEFMGSGEGAQAYGWGTYLADNPDVAKGYSLDLSGGLEVPGVHPAVNRQIARDFAGSDFQSVDEIPREWYQEIADNFRIEGMEDAARSLETADISKARVIEPNLYEVDLPDDQIEKMLDWDAPLSEQPEAVQKLFNQYADDIPELGKRNHKGDFVKTDLIEEDLILTAKNDGRLYNRPEVFRAIEKYKQNPADTTTRKRLIRYFNDYPYDKDSYPNFLAEREAEYAGSNTGELYKRIAAKIGKHDPNAVLQTDELSEGQRVLSEALSAEGIPGIKYWDGGSRAAGDGTRNYVVFDENILTILKRNDEALSSQ